MPTMTAHRARGVGDSSPAPRPAPAASPNRLFEVRVDAVERLAPQMLRLHLVGASLERLVDRELDQRIKILLPASPGQGYPAEFIDGLSERQWRRAWRALDPQQRPVLRTYTVAHARPAQQRAAVDVFLHSPAGPASHFAAHAHPGDRLLMSAPDARDDGGHHGIQFRPGLANRFWIAGDEAAFPAIAGVLRSLTADQQAQVVLECADPRDAGWILADLGAAAVDVRIVTPAGSDPTSPAGLEAAADSFLRSGQAPEGLYVWMAAETSRLAGLKRRFARAGLSADNVHGQGYWTRRSAR
ncbi:siderophore-interacting protein [Zhihengliuella flava]|uniref:NADPH-dependent ferric siderophore reductase n=1 Tax=Zhihengliuella flava TaxID=1285193 RepID=A0A931GG19_9MICC|nr:siderophore-interacting protein [Zhihengliuella flava]MBG6085292.1 NADPH-dependent ferric siderophore reductase [Zhihengliuella flava]